jgi:hypothetical protein
LPSARAAIRTSLAALVLNLLIQDVMEEDLQGVRKIR